MNKKIEDDGISCQECGSLYDFPLCKNCCISKKQILADLKGEIEEERKEHWDKMEIYHTVECCEVIETANRIEKRLAKKWKLEKGI